MRTPGMVRKMDDLGRVVIPQALREALDLQGGDPLEIGLENGKLVLRKYSFGCVFCDSGEDLAVFEEKYICASCLRKLRRV